MKKNGGESQVYFVGPGQADPRTTLRICRNHISTSARGSSAPILMIYKHVFLNINLHQAMTTSQLPVHIYKLFPVWERASVFI